MPCCPRCGSYAAQRIHRPLLAKLRGADRRYCCLDCDTVYTRPRLSA